MTRDELIEAGKQALADAWWRGVLLSQDKPGGMWAKDFGKFTITVLDAVEEKIRADERERERGRRIDRYDTTTIQEILSDERVDLRAKVEALHQRLYDSRWMVDRDDVLALLKEG